MAMVNFNTSDVMLCASMNSQITPVKHDLDQLQIHLEKEQRKYDNALNNMNEVRIIH